MTILGGNWRLVMKMLCTAVVGSLLLSGIVCAGENETTPKIDAWSGAWDDHEGGVINVRKEGQFLDVAGKDAWSVYNTVCLLSDDLIKADCSGHGVQIESGHRFILHSSWTMKDGAITERWTADLAKKKLQGTLTFRRISPHLEPTGNQP